MRKIFQKRVKILHQHQDGPGYFRVGLGFPELAEAARPGQFVMVRLPDRGIPLLRRPFSVHRPMVDGSGVCGFELFYKVVGQVTEAMSRLGAGDVLDVLGPLGNGFWYPEGIGTVFLVGGGIGVAPLYYLALELAERRAVRTVVFLGGCSATDIMCVEGFKSLGMEVRITTEDCSLGREGVITSAVQQSLAAGERPDIIYACGPTGMLRAARDIAGAYGVPCQVSLETQMACGFGVCLGCAVERAGSPRTYVHACADGPVFDAGAVLI